MKRFACCLALLALGVLAQEYTTIPLKKLTLSKYAKVENNVLTVSIPKTPAITNETRGATYDIKPELLAGKCIEFSAEMRYKDIGSDNSDSSVGAKYLARVKTNGAFGYQSCPALKGTQTKWITVATYFSCAKGMEEFRLMLGIQQGWGTVEFRNLRWRTVNQSYVDYTLPENYRCEYSPEIASRPVLRGVMSPPPLKITEKDIRDFASWGGNLFRIQLVGCGSTDRKFYNEWMDKCLDRIDALVPVFAECKVWYIIDVHSPPGLRYSHAATPGTPAETATPDIGNERAFRMMNIDEYYETFQETWRKIARRFKGRPYLYGYDLMNEPIQNAPIKHSYLQLQYETALIIRKIDPETPILVESNQGTAPATFSYLVPIPVKNVIYQVHMYLPHTFTHQGVSNKEKYRNEYPASAIPYPNPEKKWDFHFLRNSLQPVVNFQKQYGARILVGEFSATTWAPGADKYLDDVITIFEEYGWDWTYHAFREWEGWSVEHEGPPHNPPLAKQDTPRKKVLLKWFGHSTK